MLLISLSWELYIRLLVILRYGTDKFTVGRLGDILGIDLEITRPRHEKATSRWLPGADSNHGPGD
jgi:hypothetical protein